MKRHNNNSNAQRWAMVVVGLGAAAVVWCVRYGGEAGAESGGKAAALPRLAYMISGSKGDGRRVERLVRAVYHPRNYYLVRVDSEGERLELSGMGLANVMVVGRPNSVTSQGPTALAATLHSAAILLKMGPHWDWFLNLCASDYPLLSQHDLLHVLAYLPRDLNFMEHTSNVGAKEDQIARPIIIDSGLYHSKKSAIFWAKERRSIPASFKVFTGSEWVMLSRQFMESCVWGWDNLPRTLLLYYTNVLSSSEAYFQSVACNHKDFQNTTVNHNLRILFSDSDSDSATLPQMLRSGAPFLHNVPPAHPLLDAIDAHLLASCVAAACRHPDVVIPSLRSNTLETFLLSLLHPHNFRPNQCT